MINKLTFARSVFPVPGGPVKRMPWEKKCFKHS